MALTEHDLEFYRGIAKERDRLRKDCAILIANVEYLCEATGEALDEEDAAMFALIKSELETT